MSTLVINETRHHHFKAVLNHPRAGNSTNHYLRRTQNFALRARWLFEPVINELDWPKISKKRTAAISTEEHAKIIASERNLEHRLYYEMMWETGGSQTDIANLHHKHIDPESRTITFRRAKLDEREEGGEGGYANSAVVDFLIRLPDEIEIWHFGDSDPKGFDILRDLRLRTKRNIRSLHMEFRPSEPLVPLSSEDVSTCDGT